MEGIRREDLIYLVGIEYKIKSKEYFMRTQDEVVIFSKNDNYTSCGVNCWHTWKILINETHSRQLYSLNKII